MISSHQMSTKSFKQFFTERRYGEGGLEYEDEVRKAIAQASPELSNFDVLPDMAGGFASNVVDLYAVIDGKQYGFEIKQNANAQMGGSSIQFSKGKFSFAAAGAKAIDPDTQLLIQAELKGIKKPIGELFRFLRSQDPKDFHKKIETIPFTATKEAFIAAKEEGLLIPLNVKVSRDATFIHDHYNKKGCHYMQIGGAGLFYLKKNPLNLPIPQLKGSIDIEIRLGRAGSRMIKSIGMEAAGCGLRAQARFKGESVSPYSLDNYEHVLELFD